MKRSREEEEGDENGKSGQKGCVRGRDRRRRYFGSMFALYSLGRRRFVRSRALETAITLTLEPSPAVWMSDISMKNEELC